MSEIPVHLRPFVLSPSEVDVERSGRVDLYAPDGDGPFPAVVFVHGGPIPPDMQPTPREWPIFRGYGSLLASRGVFAGVVDHRLHVITGPEGPLFDHATASKDVATAVETVRQDPRVDADRIVLWYFSGGGLLSADPLRERPQWLRGVALTYPVLAPLPGWPIDPRFSPVSAIRDPGLPVPPVVLTRVGLENPDIAATVADFLTAATDCGVSVDIVDVPNGHHSFDLLDHTDESRRAVETAVGRVQELLA